MTQSFETANDSEDAVFERRLLSIRDRWNISRHPFYLDFVNGTTGVETIGYLLAQQYHHIMSVLPSLSLVYYKAPAEHRNFILDQLTNEAGLAQERSKQNSSSVDYILTFCDSVGLSRSQVESTIPLPAWRARALFNINVAHEESFASYMAIKSVTEGQQWTLNHDLMLPALKRHGYEHDDPRIAFFTRHFISNAEFGQSQISIAAASITDARARKRAIALAEETGRLYWCSMNDLYRTVVRGYVDPMPDGVK